MTLATRPVRPEKVFLPSGIPEPDLEGYERVVVAPDSADWTDLLRRYKRPFDGRPIAVLFAPGVHAPDQRFFKNLFRNSHGPAPDRPVYVGPLDRTAPLPVVMGRAELFGSYDMIVEGLCLTGGVKYGAIGGDEERHAPEIVGCYLEGGISVQSGTAQDGGKLPVRRAFISRSWIMGAQGQGIYGDHSENLIISRCVIDFAGSSGTRDHAIYLTRDVGPTIEGCILLRPSSSALKLMATEGARIRDCLIFLAHNYISANANPTPTMDRVGKDLLFEGNVVTGSGRRNDDPAKKGSGGRSYLGWDLDGGIFRDNLFIHDRGMSVFRLQKAIYNGQYAQPARDILFEKNVVYGVAGHFLTVTADAQVEGLTVRDNIVAEPEEWAGTPDHTNPYKGIETAERADAIDLIASGNIWPGWTPIDPRPETALALAGGRAAKVTFRDPSRDLSRFAGEILGVEASEEGFVQAVNGGDPGEIIDKALAYFREGFEILAIEDAEPPASLPWLDGEESEPEDPPEEDPPATEPPVEPEEEEPPVEDPENPGPQPPDEEEPPAPPVGVIAEVRLPAPGGGWYTIEIRR